MALELHYKIGQRITVSENIRDGDKKSIEVIVSDINLFSEGVKVDFELRDSINGTSKLISLHECERYNVTPLCTLHLPENPLRGGRTSKYLRKRSRKDKVRLKLYAPEEVEFYY